MPAALRQIEVEEISLVDRGANRRRFALRKSEDEPMQTETEIMKACLEAPLEDEAKIDEAIAKAGLDKRAATAIKSAIRLLTAYRDELKPEHVRLLTELAGYDDGEDEAPAKSKSKAKKSDATEEPSMPTPSQTAPAQPAADDIQKRLDAQHEAITKAQQENAELKKALDAEREQRVMRDCIEKAAKEFPMLGGKEDVAKALLAIDRAGIAELIEPLLKAANAKANATELFKEQGRGGRAKDNSAADIIAKAALEIKKASPKLTDSQAYDKALTQHRDLYVQSLQEG